MSYETILYEVSEGILTLTLNRPEKLNAINGLMEDEIDHALQTAEADDAVRVVIMAGAGRAFSSGYDISTNVYPNWRDAGIHGASEAVRNRAMKHKQCMLRLWNLPKPVIAAVHGYCLAGGCEYAMMCDFRIAAEDTQFGEPEIRHFSGPPTLIMPWLVPIGHVKELLLTGDRIDAAQAERIGLVNRVVPRDRLMDEVRRIARKMCLIHPLALKLNKAAINRSYEARGLMNALDANIELATLHHTYALSVNEENLKLRTGSAKEFLKAREAAFRELDRPS